MHLYKNNLYNYMNIKLTVNSLDKIYAVNKREVIMCHIKFI